MNAMELITTGANDFSFINKNLQNATMKIVRLTDNARNALYQIAFIIAGVAQTECYKDDGFNTVHEWTTQVLGYKKSMSYDLLKIGQQYTREILNDKGRVTGYECNLLPEDSADNFSTTQVIRMLPAERELVCELVEDKIITPAMTSKEIAKVIKERVNGESGESEEATEDKPNGDTPEVQSVDLSKVSTNDLIAELAKRGYLVADSNGKWLTDSKGGEVNA